jgi:hypothetical protein
MATPVREFSLDNQYLEHLKYCGIEPQNLSDLIGLFASVSRIKYGLVPFAMAVEGYPHSQHHPE